MRPARRATTALASLALVSLSCGTLTGAPLAGTRASTAIAPGAWHPQEPGTGYEEIVTSLRQLPTGLLPAELSHVARVIRDQSQRSDVSPALVLAIVHVESSGYNFARSHAGALGLMQVRPTTGRAVARRLGVHWRGPETLFDAGTNVRVGIAYLGELVRRYGDLPTALAAYNWGPTRISSFVRRGRPVPVVYADRVLATYRATRERSI